MTTRYGIIHEAQSASRDAMGQYREAGWTVYTVATGANVRRATRLRTREQAEKVCARLNAETTAPQPQPAPAPVDDLPTGWSDASREYRPAAHRRYIKSETGHYVTTELGHGHRDGSGATQYADPRTGRYTIQIWDDEA